MNKDNWLYKIASDQSVDESKNKKTKEDIKKELEKIMDVPNLSKDEQAHMVDLILKDIVIID
jgi:hypothetical protein